MQINQPKITRISEQSSVLLDLTRATAAILVFLTHLRYLFFVDFSSLGSLQHNYFLKAFYFLTSIGHESVMVFFVLSGYFISMSVFRMREKDQWSWSGYAVSRLTRLYIVLIPALVFGAVLDIFGPRIFGPVGLYSPVLNPGYAGMYLQPISATTTLYNWIGCLFFLQYIRCAPFGSNGPLWSLSYEFWYYVLFPQLLGCVYALFPPRRSWGALFANALLFLGLLWFIGPGLRVGFIVWMLGVGVCLIPPPRATLLQGRLPRYVSFALLFVMIMFLKAGPLRHVPPDLQSLLIGFCFALFLYFCIHGVDYTFPGFLAKLIRFAASISYSLYLFHVPMLVFLSVAIFKGGSRWMPDLPHFLLLSVVALATLCYVVGLWRLTEANTDIVRKKLERSQAVS